MAEADQDDVTLTINYNKRTGLVKCDGPVNDPVLCYGMLELAKDVVRMAMMEQARQAMAQQIARPNVILPAEFRRR